jgi:lipopolysaccharide transport system permease protein
MGAERASSAATHEEPSMNSPPVSQVSIEIAQQISPHRTVIKPRPGWQAINWREIREYRDLFAFLVVRDVTVVYKQTVLGLLWAVVRPLATMLVFSVIFGGLARVPSDGVPYPIFSYTALLPWTYFSTAITKSTASLVANAQMFTKVYYPRLIIPLTPIFSGLMDFGIAAVMLAILMVAYGIAPTLNIVFLPILILVMLLTASGVGLWLSALSVQYRDVNQAMQFVTQLLMYAAPVVWPVSLITKHFSQHGEQIRLIYGLYPMAGVISGFRAALLGTTPMPWDLVGIGFLSASVLFVSGAFYFRRMERIFADVA